MPKKMSRRGSGEGSIYYDNARNKYIGKIAVGRRENGSIKYKKVSGDSVTEVQRKLDAIKFQIMDGSFLEVSRITFGQLAKQILDEKLNLNVIKENTYFRNVETLKMMNEISCVPLQQINTSMIKDFLLKQTHYSDSTINKFYIILGNTINEALDRKIIAENPMYKVKKPKSLEPTKKIRALSREEQFELENVLNENNIPYRLQMLISMYTGCRMGEVNALKVNDVSLPFGTLSISRTISRGKTGEVIINTPKTAAGSRTFRMTDPAKELLKQAVEEYKSSGYNDGFLFHDKKGKLTTTSAVNLQLQRTVEKYNIEDHTLGGIITCHSLRHTFATRCIEAGMPAKVVSKKLGHTDIKITLNTYSDVFSAFEDVGNDMFNDYIRNAKKDYNGALMANNA